MITHRGLEIANIGSVFTFVRGNTGSIPDITLVSEGVALRIQNWRVEVEKISLSDHRYIYYEIVETCPPPVIRGRGWKVGCLDREKLSRKFEELASRNERMNDGNLVRTVTKTCNEVIPRKGTRRAGDNIYWWNEGIAALGREYLAARRRSTRGNRRQKARERPVDSRDYREAKKRLSNAIKKAKREKWRKLCDSIDNDVWGDGCKIATKRLRTPPTSLPKERIDRIVTVLFSEREEVRWERRSFEEPPLFTEEELKKAGQRLKSGKAPGPDEIPPEVVRILVEDHPGIILTVMNRAVQEGDFPKRWRRARLDQRTRPPLLGQFAY